MDHPNPPSPVNILLVDDIQENVLAYKALLAPLGHTLVGVNSGEDALREVLDKDFAVIIMDVRMPGLDGYETATLIKKRPSSQHVPIIFVTASDDEPLMGYSVGAMDYMYKPVNVKVLQAKVNAFVELHNVKKGLEEANKLLKAAKEAAENATLLKDKFLSLVSHDLKGPLGALRGFLQLIRSDLQQSGKHGSIKFIDVAVESINRMLAMVNDLLNVGRLKSGIIIPRLALLNARELAGGELQSLAPSAAVKDVQLVNGMPEGMELCADWSLLAEVIQNLVSNAIKFSHKGGTVRVFSPGPGMIAVGDGGVGIPPDRRVILFRYEESISTRGTAGEVGTGFGLPLSYDLVKAHGGELTFESEEGKGSTFSVRLPIHACPVGVCQGTKETCPRFLRTGPEQGKA